MNLHLAAAGLVFTLSLSAQAAVTSTFDTDAEGWSGLTARPGESSAPIHNAGPFGSYSATGGNPGGYFRLPDPDDQDTFFSAPAQFLGNQSSAVGGTLSYDLYTDASINYAGPNVVLQGGGVTLVYVLTTQPAVQNSWVTVSVALAPSAFWHLGSAGGGALAGQMQRMQEPPSTHPCPCRGRHRPAAGHWHVFAAGIPPASLLHLSSTAVPGLQVSAGRDIGRSWGRPQTG